MKNSIRVYELIESYARRRGSFKKIRRIFLLDGRSINAFHPPSPALPVNHWPSKKDDFDCKAVLSFSAKAVAGACIFFLVYGAVLKIFGVWG